MSLPFALSLIFAALMVGLLVGAIATWMSMRRPVVEVDAPVIGRDLTPLPTESREPTPQLMARMQELTQRYERQIEVMRKAHEIERAGAEEELRVVREKLERIIMAGEKGQSISNNAFVPTQFDETPPPAKVSKSSGFASTQFEERPVLR
jgi:hypothetical protein